jgi:fatty-acyl-CoA synthase
MTATVFPCQPDPIRFWRRIAPERTALVDRGRGGRWSYAELDMYADRWAALLRAAGVGKGERVATLAGNRAEQVGLFFACGRIGAALVPLNWRLPASELAPILADAAPRITFGESRFRATAEQADPALAWIDLDSEAPPLLERGGQAAPDVEICANDPLLVLYTSGSTGSPKGAVLPHRQILWNAVATATAWDLGAGDVAPVTTPLFHTGGWNVFATPLWHRGGTVVLFGDFDPAGFLDGLAEERCTIALTVPTQLLMLQQSASWGQPLPALRRFVSGGAPCPPAVAERVRVAGYGFREGYGLTECGPNCFAISDPQARARPGSVGWPVPFLEMRLLAEDGRLAAPDEPGELVLRGPQLFAGYLNDPERTREAFTEDGWLRTGDLAVRDPDGAYRICGRRKEMYISGGENVFPAEVESVLADCPGIAEVVVVGVPDALWGEVGRAFLVRTAENGVTGASVFAHARKHLAGYKVPKAFEFVEQIPRLGSGKPDRRALVTQAVKGGAQ